MLRLTASLLLFTALLAGCSSSSAEGAEVAIHGNTYNPSSVTVKAGEHVHFANHDAVEHSITPDSGGFSGKDIDGEKEADIDFPAAGTFAYHCKYHPAMHGTVTVS
ncbi:MAG TPA: cupredoxin domain-containing protein [Candidatus Thermoplasmatota archaeon]|nr:cupredoxin domain-containing protein [Candidatus Thermoplasmatota archaeon]